MTHNPLTQAWLVQLRRRLEPRGMKADLARHLAAHFGQDDKYWQRRLQTILGRDGSPQTEFYLATEDFFQTRTARRR